MSFDIKKRYFFPRGAIALAEAAKALMADEQKTGLTIFLPDYFCNQALSYLRRLPVKLAFYPLTAELKPDWNFMAELLAESGRPDIFILVHYFGFVNDVESALAFCRQHEIKLLEDASHCLFDYGKIGKDSWAAIFSPYKLLPIPRLGVLKINKNYNIQEKKATYALNDLLWLIKYWLKNKKVIYKMFHKYKKVRPFKQDPAGGFKNFQNNSKLAIKRFKTLENKFAEVKKRRREIYTRYLQNINSACHETLFPEMPAEACPYLLPLKVAPDKIDRLYQRLNAKLIPAGPWPDLPPEVKQNPDRHKRAVNLRKTILTLPVEQTLTDGQIKHIISILKQND